MTWFDDCSPSQLLEELSVRLYEPPLSVIRRKGSLGWPEPLRNVALFLDFDTEVSMQGLLGFLENATEGHLSETIDAFRAIGAESTAQTLLAAQVVMERHWVSLDTFRSNVDSQGRTVTSFAQRHGDEGIAMAREIAPVAERLYLNEGAEDAYALIERYVGVHEQVIREALRVLVGAASAR